MSNYVKATNFTALSGSNADPAIFDTEFSSIAVASATKADKAGAIFTGAIAVPAGATGTQAPQAQEVKNHSFPIGTKMAFFQATAPIGWTQDVTNNDAMLRVVSTAGGGAGGTMSVANVSSVTGGHQLKVTEMPSHSHGVTGGTLAFVSGTIGANTFAGGQNMALGTVAVSNKGGNAAHTHTFAFSPKYIDVIVCTKV